MVRGRAKTRRWSTRTQTRRGNERGCSMGRARGLTAEQAAQERCERARKDVVVAELVRAAHLRLRLWRLCRRARCKRARCCRGDLFACGARRWPVARAFFQELIDTRGKGVTTPARRRAAA